MGRVRMLVLVGILLATLVTPHSLRAEEVAWRYDYNAARREAREQGRPLLLNIGSDNCIWCQKLDASTLRDPAITALLKERVLPLKVNGSREPALVQALGIQAYPTLVLAGPNGKIFETLEGFVEVPRLRAAVERLLAAVEAPAWMTREYQEAASAAEAADYPHALRRLRKVLEDGEERPVQVRARQLVQDIEQRAAIRLAQYQELLNVGQQLAALEALADFTRTFSGTQAAAEGAKLHRKLADDPKVKALQRQRQARELVLRAREDFRAKRFLASLERCELLTAQFADLPEGAEGRELAAAIKDHPERLEQVCDALAVRWGEMQLLLAQSLRKQGRPEEAARRLEQVIQNLPGTPGAARAKAHLERLHPDRTTDAPTSADDPPSE